MAEWPFQRNPPRSMQSYPMGYWLWLSSIQRCKPHNSFYVNPWNFILQAGLCVRVELHEAFSTSLPLSCQHQPDIENHRMRCSKPIKMQADNSKSEWKVPCCVICFSFGPSLFLWPLFLFFFPSQASWYPSCFSCPFLCFFPCPCPFLCWLSLIHLLFPS